MSRQGWSCSRGGFALVVEDGLLHIEAHYKYLFSGSDYITMSEYLAESIEPVAHCYYLRMTQEILLDSRSETSKKVELS